MKNIEIKNALKRLIALGSLSFVLVTTGCSSKENNAEPSNEVTTEVENNNEQENTANANDTQETENNNTEDNEIVKYFEDKNKELNSTIKEENSLLYTDNIELTNEIWNEYFIDAIDFIFYDKEYKDTKFADLNPEAQQKCIDELQEAENKMNMINPNWKEDLGNIKDATAEAYSNLLYSIENLIGTDNYNKIKDSIGSLKDGLSDIGNSIKDSANNLYQGYKSSHQK